MGVIKISVSFEIRFCQFHNLDYVIAYQNERSLRDLVVDFAKLLIKIDVGFVWLLLKK